MKVDATTQILKTASLGENWDAFDTLVEDESHASGTLEPDPLERNYKGGESDELYVVIHY
jgi:hypothetical protein